MSKRSCPSRSRRGLFSFDAAFALSFALAAFAMFAWLSFSAAGIAERKSGEISDSLFALRLSSFVLEGGAAGVRNESPGAHFVMGGVSEESADAKRVFPKVLESGRSYVRISAYGESGEEILSSSEGKAAADAGIFCSRRLAIMDGSPARLEVCVS